MNLNVDNANIKQVFKRIEQQANVTFVYDARVINKLPGLTLHISKQPLSDVLTELHNQTQLQFKLVGNFIGVAQNLGSMPILTPVSVDTKATIKITGLVRDASGQPLIGVSVTRKGTASGTTTNVNGQFDIDANIGDVL
ncbi:carboxypeptidase-like regulatory domain-containing protein, partial [Mucilaginibacter humi]